MSSLPVWADAIIGAAGTGVGILLGPPLRTAYLRLRGSRRYQERLRSLEARSPEARSPEADAGHETRPGRPGQVVTRELPPDQHEGLDSRFPYFFVSELHVDNMRCFAEANLDFRFPGERGSLLFPNVNLLLGDNGTGKSTILRAIAMAALAPILQDSGFVPYRLITQGAAEAGITSSFVFGGPSGPLSLPSRISVTRRGDFESVEPLAEGPYWADLFDESSPSFFVAGYGTNRRVADDPRADPSQERGRRRRRYQRVASLFEDSVSLVPLAAWLPQMGEERKAEVRDLMKLLLPQGASFTGRFDGGEPIFRRKGFEVPLRALSDGFRSYIGWLSDLLFQMCAIAPAGARLNEIGGIALVDEVDLLLHPSWQRVVVPTLSRMLPSVQFIFTTHSPIVAGTLQAGNVIVAREQSERGVSALERIDAEIHGLSAEQVLLSSYFELETTRAPDALPALEELARGAVQGDPEATRAYLRALAGSDPPARREPRR